MEWFGDSTQKSPLRPGDSNLQPSRCRPRWPLTCYLHYVLFFQKWIKSSLRSIFPTQSSFVNKWWRRAKRREGSSSSRRSAASQIAPARCRSSWAEHMAGATLNTLSIQNAWRPTIQQNAFMESWASLLHSSCRASGWCLAALHEWLGYWPRFSNGISKICGKKENPSLIRSWQMFASDNHPAVLCQNVGLAEEQQWRKDLLCFYWRRRLSAALVRYAAALLCWRHSCLSERVRYLIFRHSQRNTHSPRRLNRPVKPNCAGGNLSPPPPATTICH